MIGFAGNVGFEADKITPRDVQDTLQSLMCVSECEGQLTGYEKIITNRIIEFFIMDGEIEKLNNIRGIEE